MPRLRMRIAMARARVDRSGVQFFLAITVALSSFHQAGADTAVIESIEGDRIVVVKSAAGNRVAERGSLVEIGERVRTGPRASAKIVFKDGSKLFIARASEVEVQATEQGVQWAQLNEGEVRGLIKKAAPPTVAGAKRPPPKFAIRTRAAVMGVRGTDFVFGVEPSGQRSQLHTLEGTVEVAKDDASLLEGRGVSVVRDQMVSADQNQIAPPSAFDRKAYVRDLEAAQPEFVALANADPEAVAHRPGYRSEADSIAPEPPTPRWQGGLFQLGGLAFFDGGQFRLASGELSWNPSLRVFGPLHLRAQLGGFPIKSDRAKYSVALDAALLANLTLFDLIFGEAGVGGVAWLGYETSPLVVVNAGLRLGDAGWLERIYVGISGVGHSGGAIGGAAFRAGIGVRL